MYGYGDTLNRAVDRMATQALSSQPVEVMDPGNVADFTAVADLASGLFLALTVERAAGQTFNMTRGEGRTNLDVGRLIVASVSGAVLDVWDKDRHTAPRRATMSITRATPRAWLSVGTATQ